MKKYYVIIFIFLLVFLLTNTVSFAQPRITQIYGSLNHGEFITIYGSDFGIKNPAAPILWQDCESETVNSPSAAAADFVEVNPTASFDNSPGDEYSLQYRTSWAGVSQPHVYSTKYLAGGHYNNCGANDYCNIVGACIDMGSEQNVVYASWYLRFHEDFDAEGSGNRSNYKEIWLDGGRGITSTNVLYFSKGNDWPYNAALTAQIHSNVASYCPGGSTQFEANTLHNCVGSWVRREFIFDTGDSDDYLEYVSYDGSTRESQTSSGCNFGGGSITARRTFCLGSFARRSDDPIQNYTHNGMKRYFDDLYLDNTFSRVVLANSQTISSATIVEPQIPSAWSNGSITVKVNLGKLPNSGTSYLFVFDQNNDKNLTGYPVSINGTPPGSSIPNPPGNLRIVNN